MHLSHPLRIHPSRGTWGPQSVKRLTLAEVIILPLVSPSPTLGLCCQCRTHFGSSVSLAPCPFPVAALFLSLSLCLSLINTNKEKKARKQASKKENMPSLSHDNSVVQT